MRRERVRPTMQEHGLWRDDELCKKLDLSLSDLNDWTKDGLPYCDLGSRKFFYEQDVVDYLWKNKQNQGQNS